MSDQAFGVYVCKLFKAFNESFNLFTHFRGTSIRK
ncbi:hypothetical protein HacjB3_02780 [Halalkalicoccus jeotgali B3]|uniref:Uncharacterized protein n=1 Tax=Halalkalicoccus jeotgali (strain DSM 18796 / CECT 7217 / JCM 14584 / KCTC 4019 / B3) TaxID=795797 RepID=D8J754_HALJB|nr:hypothetical protein HacjB3_02780 [Halalkalicoccus jeotgali B3]